MKPIEPDQKAVIDLKSALARLKENGWTSGKFHDIETGKCCALGAFTNKSFAEETPGVPYLAYAIRNRKGGHRYPADMPDMSVVVRFNDASRRKWEHVEAVFDEAIRCAEAGELNV